MLKNRKKILNNYGYMLVEIIVASVIALVVAWFLIDITVKMVNKNNDYYLESVLLADKNVITKEIMDDLNDSSKTLYKIELSDTKKLATFIFRKDDGTDIEKKLIIEDDDGDGAYSITYGDYKRELSKELNISDINFVVTGVDEDTNLFYIDIPATTNYSAENYGINIPIPYEKSETGADLDIVIIPTFEITESYVLEQEVYSIEVTLEREANSVECEVSDPKGSGTSQCTITINSSESSKVILELSGANAVTSSTSSYEGRAYSTRTVENGTYTCCRTCDYEFLNKTDNCYGTDLDYLDSIGVACLLEGTCINYDTEYYCSSDCTEEAYNGQPCKCEITTNVDTYYYDVKIIYR